MVRWHPAALAVVIAIGLVACGSGDKSGTEGGARGSRRFGTTASPCGQGRASGATQLGVTDSTITIGFGDDSAAASSPGLNVEMSEAIRAMIDWCNEQGGIEGRRLVGDEHDAAITDVETAMRSACARDFMLVGQGWLLDDAQERTRLACSLATVPTFAVSERFATAPLMVQPSPDPPESVNAAGAFLLAAAYPTKVRRAATMQGNQPTARAETARVVSAFEQAGWQFLPCGQEYNIGGEANWIPFVQRLKDCGAEVVHFSGSMRPTFEEILRAARAIGFDPIWMQDASVYDSDLAAWNSEGLADNVHFQMTYYPFEQADRVPAVADYLDIMRAAGAPAGLLGAQAVAAFLLWAEGAKACGSDLTSDCVMRVLKNVSDYDAGGLQSPTNPGANLPGNCAMVLRVRGTRYEQVLPSDIAIQACDRTYRVSVGR